MCKGGVSDQRRVAFRHNLAEILIQVQSRHDTILIKKDGKPGAALMDGRLFERIEDGYAAMPETEGLAEIDAAVADTRAYPASVSGKLIAAWRHGALDVVLSATILDIMSTPWRNSGPRMTAIDMPMPTLTCNDYGGGLVTAFSESRTVAMASGQLVWITRSECVTQLLRRIADLDLADQLEGMESSGQPQLRH